MMPSLKKMSITFNYNGQITTDIKTHLKLIKLFGRQPTATEFAEIFKVDPMMTVHIKPWIAEMTLSVDGFAGLEVTSIKTLVSLMIKNHATADGIHKVIDDIIAIEGMTPWAKKAKKYFNKVDATDELVEAIATFHEDGLVADGLKLQAEYDDYIHRVVQRKATVCETE